MIRLRYLAIILSCLLPIAVPVAAQETSGSFEHSILIGEDSRECVSGLSGSLRYNASDSCIEYCDGNEWTCPSGGGGGLTGPSGCEDVGDLCADGTVFVGYHPYTHEHLFIPTTDQSGSARWKTSTGADDIATDSLIDGRINTDQVPNNSTFPAFKLCKDLAIGGHTDWYMPSRGELDYIFNQLDQIAAAGHTDLADSYYLSSTEYSPTVVWNQIMNIGLISQASKTTTSNRLRCLRR